MDRRIRCATSAQRSAMSFSDSRRRFARVGDESACAELMNMKEGGTTGLTLNMDDPTGISSSKKRDKRSSKSLRAKVLSRVFSEDYERVENKILDPRGSVVRTWNRIFLAACMVSLFLDPIFFYIPSADINNTCLHDEYPLKITLTIMRSVADVFYLIQVVIRFNTAFVAPSSRVFGRGELVINSRKIALRYLCKNFWIDLFAMLPLPQVLLWGIIPSLPGPNTTKAKNVVRFIIFFQYLPRLFLILPLRSEIVDASGGLTETAWAGAAYNLLLYLLGSHVSGSCWYLLTIARQEYCWKTVCEQETPSCQFNYFDCRNVQDPGRVTWYGSTNVTSLCNPSNTSPPVQWGIFQIAASNLLPSSKFFSKYFYCLWWGLNNLSDIGQNLLPSTYVGELLFTISVASLGLILFALLIGNMQRFLQSTTARLEKWRLKRTDTEIWMHHRHLPPELRQSIRKYEEYKWVATRGVDEEALLNDLPMDLRREIKRHLCYDLVRNVPLFNQMDERTLDAICERLKPVLCTENMFLVREGNPVREMFFVIRGHLDSWTTDGDRRGFFNSSRLGPGDFCGEELLTWALDPRPSIVLPSSTRTVQAAKDVEAFCLEAEDLRFVASQFRRLRSKELRHRFRFYSHHWRTWAACYIQSAWRHYKKVKEEATLSTNNSGLPGSEGKLRPSSSFWDIYATKLIESTRRDESKPEEPMTSDCMNTVQKPLDLDFSVEY